MLTLDTVHRHTQIVATSTQHTKHANLKNAEVRFAESRSNAVCCYQILLFAGVDCGREIRAMPCLVAHTNAKFANPQFWIRAPKRFTFWSVNSTFIGRSVWPEEEATAEEAYRYAIRHDILGRQDLSQAAGAAAEHERADAREPERGRVEPRVVRF